MLIASTATDAAAVVVAAFVGVAGLVLSWSIRRDVALKVADRRLEAYERLWALMRVVGKAEEPLDRGGQLRLHGRLTDWYYRHGDGLVLAKGTNAMLLHARDNIVREDGNVVPQEVAARLTSSGDVVEARGELLKRQLSLLRTQMKSDLAVYGSPYGDVLDNEDRAFLLACRVDPTRQPWRS